MIVVGIYYATNAAHIPNAMSFMKKTVITTAAALTFICGLSPNAHALSISDPNVMGIIVDAVPFGDDRLTLYVNHLLSMSSPSTQYYRAFGTGPCTSSADLGDGCDLYTRTSVNPANDSGVVSLTGSYKNTSSRYIPEGYEYLVAKYDGPNGGAVVFYLAGEDFTLPDKSVGIWDGKNGKGFGLSGWVAYGTVSVPDGGSTAALLGCVLLAFGMLRGKLSKS